MKNTVSASATFNKKKASTSTSHKKKASAPSRTVKKKAPVKRVPDDSGAADWVSLPAISAARTPQSPSSEFLRIKEGLKEAWQDSIDKNRYETLPSGKVVPARNDLSDYWEAQMSSYMFSIGA